MSDFLHYYCAVDAELDGRWCWIVYSRWDTHDPDSWTGIVGGSARWKWLARWRGAKRVRHLRHRKVGRRV